MRSVDLPEIAEHSLHEDDNILVATLLKDLCSFESVIKQIQKDSTTVADTRHLSYAIIALDTYTKPQPVLNADIINDSHFETAVIEIQSKKEASLLSIGKKCSVTSS